MSQLRPCDTCGENDYYEQGGFYYCQECNTQSQVMREIVASADQFNLTMHQTAVYTKVDQRIAELEKVEVDYGIPWTTHDAFGLLLQTQAETLVRLGAPAALPPLVEKLWTRYQDRRAGRTPKPRVRDLAKDLTKGLAPVSSWRSIRKSKGKWPKTVDPKFLNKEEKKDWIIQNGGISEEEADKLVEQEEEEEEEKKKKRREEEEEEVEENGNREMEEDCQEDLGLSDRAAFAQIRRMRMGFSLGFMYLALLHLQSSITLGDLIRWCRECHIPYLNPMSFFPENMKFTNFDLNTFASVKRVPPALELITDTGRLVLFLQLNPFPAVDLRRQVTRFLMDLNLPEVILNVTSRLISVLHIASPTHLPLEGHIHSISLPNYEAISVTVLLMSLKLIFRLDGVTEFVLSHLVDELHQHSESSSSETSANPNKNKNRGGLWYTSPVSTRPNVFSFKEWFQFAADALTRIKSRQFPDVEEVESNGGVGFPRDVAFLARYYAHNLVNKTGSVRRTDLPTRDFIDSLQDSVAALLLSDADLSAPQSAEAPTSFPVLAVAGRGDGDATAEAEWRESIDAPSHSSADNVGGKGFALKTKFAKLELGILVDVQSQKDLIKDDSLLLKLNLPSYEIDEFGRPQCDWKTSDGMNDVSLKLENNKNCLKNLFSHQSKYSCIVEIDEDFEKKRMKKGTDRLRRRELTKYGIFRVSKTVGVFVELCAKMIEQEPRQLLYDIHRIEGRYPME